jgi:hypothetical protein
MAVHTRTTIIATIKIRKTRKLSVIDSKPKKRLKLKIKITKVDRRKKIRLVELLCTFSTRK